MMAALGALLLLSAAAAPDWFRVFQYSGAAVSLRGCSECQGEPDDLCEVRAGAQSLPLADYDQKRWPGADRVRLLRAKADPDCAAPAPAFYGSRSHLELAAIRVSRAAPGAAVAERVAARSAVSGWPKAPHRRKGQQPSAAQLNREGVRAALVCWSAERGWPGKALDAGSPCEFWLLPFRADGEPDLAGHSFPLFPRRDRWPEQFRYGDARWARAFDRTLPLDDAVLLGEAGGPVAPAAPASVAPTTPLSGARAGAPPVPPAALSRCGDEARSRSGVLDRFDQWEGQIAGARRSLDRGRWTIDLTAWSGHCQELDVLRTALEQQLGCSLGDEGRCVAPTEVAR